MHKTAGRHRFGPARDPGEMKSETIRPKIVRGPHPVKSRRKIGLRTRGGARGPREGEADEREFNKIPRAAKGQRSGAVKAAPARRALDLWGYGPRISSRRSRRPGSEIPVRRWIYDLRVRSRGSREERRRLDPAVNWIRRHVKDGLAYSGQGFDGRESVTFE